MHPRSWFAIACLTGLSGASCPARSAPAYAVTMLPASLYGANGIDNAGRIAGTGVFGGNARALLYAGGSPLDLGTLGGPTSYGYGISDDGKVTGSAALSSNLSHAFVYADGAMHDLGALPGGRNSGGSAVNDLGQVAGSSEAGGDEVHAVLADANGMRDLGTLGGKFSYAAGINDAGHVVGASTLADGGRHAFFYRDGAMSDLGNLGGVYSFADRINDRDQIVGGIVDDRDVAHPFVYENGVATLLGDFGGQYSGAWDINNRGQVVGYSTFDGTIESRHGFLYTEGQLLDINSLIDPAPGLTVSLAVGINDAGQILGFACRPDACAPVRLDPLGPPPVPEPAAVAMLLGGLAAGAAWRRRLLSRACPHPCARSTTT